MQRWDRLVGVFMEEYEARGNRQGTVDRMQRELDLWGSWLKRRRPKPRLDALCVDVDLIAKYVAARNAFRSKSTLSSHLSALRQFGEYLVRERVWDRNPLRWMSGPRRDPRAPLPKRLGRMDLDRLFSAAAAHRIAYFRHVTVVVLSLLYGTGIRRGELARVDVGDWDSERGILRVDGRKTGWERTVPVPDVAWRYVEAYLPVRHNLLERSGRVQAERALVLNGRGERMGLTGLSRLVHRCASAAGVPLRSVHQFRHTCASDLGEQGRSLPEVKALLGHRVIGTACDDCAALVGACCLPFGGCEEIGALPCIDTGGVFVGFGMSCDECAGAFGACCLPDGGCQLLPSGFDGSVECGFVLAGVFYGGATCVICPCPDFDGDGRVGFSDLTSLLAQWGGCVSCPADLNGDGMVGLADLTLLLAAWGPCPR